ncbi:MAG: hypothetical protein FJ265_00925 [Planctomycetes bacterium]|nr:hypothetical protein [Planctomycetota bacterium]
MRTAPCTASMAPGRSHSPRARSPVQLLIARTCSSGTSTCRHTHATAAPSIVSTSAPLRRCMRFDAASVPLQVLTVTPRTIGAPRRSAAARLMRGFAGNGPVSPSCSASRSWKPAGVSTPSSPNRSLPTTQRPPRRTGAWPWRWRSG